MATPNIENVKTFLLTLQDNICQALGAEDPGCTWQEDIWQHAGGGGGRTRVIKGPKVFEQGGVNFSHVVGKQLPASASVGRQDIAGHPFEATGLSLIMHPHNPFVPTVHANIRFFISKPANAEPVWWFGGGIDLTPYYGFVEDCVHWHKTSRAACAAFGEDVYPKYKKACDEYFYNKHRQECRGIGGLFFDDLNEWGFEKSFAFFESVGNHVLPAYLPIVFRRKETPFTQAQRDFQCYRRGRYVEFNLVYDRGTLFGLQSGGRTESILVSMPPVVHFSYMREEPEGSKERKLTDFYLKPKDWLSYEHDKSTVSA